MWVGAPRSCLVFLLEGVLGDAGLVSPRKGIWGFDPLCSEGGWEFCVEAGLGSSTEALQWSKLLLECGIPPFFGKVEGIRTVTSHGITGLPHPAAAGNCFGWMEIVQANKDEFSWDLCKREMSFFPKCISEGLCSNVLCQCSRVFYGKNSRKGGFESFPCNSMGSCLAFPRDSGFQLLLPVLRTP